MGPHKMQTQKEVIQNRMIIGGKVKDVIAQLEMMCKQFPDWTVKQMLDHYNLREMILC
jgi:hypothetical protein